MNRRTLKTLEYNKIIDQLTGFAASKGGKHLCQKLTPSTDLVEVERWQTNTRDAFLRLENYGNLSFAGVYDVRETINLLRMGSPLSAGELLDLASLLEAVESIKSYDDSCESQANDSLKNIFSELIMLRDLSSEIRRCIISSDEIADDASSNLRSIRKKITSKNASLHHELERIIKSDAVSAKLQDAIITTRGGRYCIPIRAEYRNTFPGMVHDRSATGQTVFIEPMEVVNLNNEISELHDDEREEIEKILKDLSDMAKGAVDDIKIDYDLAVELDFIFAKAKYARDIKASEPTISTEKTINLKAARHPLLDRKTAVPVDIRLGNEYGLLIITGPNTGGKTVSLKTLGLLSLMGQAGLHIPALEGSKLTMFNDVFADIGDEQSIEQNLSTFSSHMSNIVYILNHADDRSLCLFDEPGGGTDPAEGAALAISILNTLKDRGSLVMATTHYTELKTFAIGTPGVENASCEFDIKTLRPTYHLMIGVPGSSNAFAIASKLGMDESVIEAARANMDEAALNMEQIINELEASRREIERDRIEMAELKEQAARLKQSFSDKDKSISERREDILKKAREEAREIIADAKEEVDEAIRDINRWKKAPGKADARQMEKVRTDLRTKAKNYEPKVKKKAEISGQKPEDFHIGDKVLVLSLQTEGHVIDLPNARGQVNVGMGIITSRFPISDLLILPEEKTDNKEKVMKFAGTDAGSSKAYTFKPEINLLGKTVDEALSALDKFLDDALLTHTSTVRIVHGKGTGALRKGITEYLKKQRYVKSFRAGEFGEGDSGVTIVEL